MRQVAALARAGLNSRVYSLKSLIIKKCLIKEGKEG
jgi:hypothetical protein